LKNLAGLFEFWHFPQRVVPRFYWPSRTGLTGKIKMKKRENSWCHRSGSTSDGLFFSRMKNGTGNLNTQKAKLGLAE
jgi:hypothetical protein